MRIRFFNPGLTFQKDKDEYNKEINRVLTNGDVILREDVERFEKELAAIVGTKYAIGLNSGTDALFLSLKALGVGIGDEVITVSHTFVATIEAIVHNGATPILIDVKQDGLMDVEQIIPAITEKTKAIIPVHLEGNYCDMIKILNIAEEYGLFVIEDSAQALGAKIDGMVGAGSVGAAGCFSFYPAKILGSFGDAGALTTNNDWLAQEIRKLRNHYNIKGSEVDVKYGFNMRLDNLQAAILNVRIKRLPEILKRREEIAMMYNDGLISPLIVKPKIKVGRVWQDYVIRTKHRKELKECLDKNEIETLGANLIPNHKYLGLGLDFDLPVTEQIYTEQLRLPCNDNLTVEEVDYVIEKVNQFFK